MTIRIETSKRHRIKNSQDTEISLYELRWSEEIPSDHPQVRKRTEPSPSYNCHGLTFACRRSKIFDSNDIATILHDDSYQLIENTCDAMPGDIVIYYSTDGDPNHSGIVVAKDNNDIVPRVCSKWGNAGEYVHGLLDVPSLYGPHHKIFRCRL